MSTPRLRLAGTVLSTRDARSPAAIDERLLGRPGLIDEHGLVVLRQDAGSAGLSFHDDVEYVPPT